MNHWKSKRGLLAFAAIAIAMVTCKSYGEGDFAEASALAKIQVKARIQIQKDADLLFPNAYQGDPEKTVAPSDSGAAQFSVRGEKGYNFSITFPDSSILMKTGTGDVPDKQIQVDKFNSDQPGNVGTIDRSSGVANIRVGARRAAISTSQEVADDYSGVFKVRVTYLN